MKLVLVTKDDIRHCINAVASEERIRVIKSDERIELFSEFLNNLMRDKVMGNSAAKKE